MPPIQAARKVRAVFIAARARRAPFWPERSGGYRNGVLITADAIERLSFQWLWAETLLSISDSRSLGAERLRRADQDEAGDARQRSASSGAVMDGRVTTS